MSNQPNPLPVSLDVLVGSIDQTKWVADKWAERMKAGIPGATCPGTQEQFEAFMAEFLNEWQLLSLNSGNLYEILSAGFGRGL